MDLRASLVPSVQLYGSYEATAGPAETFIFCGRGVGDLAAELYRQVEGVTSGSCAPLSTSAILHKIAPALCFAMNLGLNADEITLLDGGRGAGQRLAHIYDLSALVSMPCSQLEMAR